MLDTIKVGIPLTAQQHKRILNIAQEADRYQWVLGNPVTGEMVFRHVSGVAYTDQNSYHRELRWDVDKTYDVNCKLYMEFSVPKFYYSHNIHLLHNFSIALTKLQQTLNERFRFSKRLSLVDPPCWTVLRADLCYAWRFSDQVTAQHYLNSLKTLGYPKKKPIIYPESIVFPGGTFTIKFYLKYPEFKAHDYKALLKAKTSLEWIEHLEKLATGVLRYEITLRTKFLRRRGINTVADLLKTTLHIEWDESLSTLDEVGRFKAMLTIFTRFAQEKNIDLKDYVRTLVDNGFKDGMTFTAPESELFVTLMDDTKLYHHYPGGGFTIRQQSNLELLLQYFINRFLGENVKMQSADEVKLKLLQHYKPVKASRLVSFWLYVQRFGEEDAKETFGRDSFYASKRDLKKAGVGLLDEKKLTTSVDADFLRRFSLTVPSENVTNKFDDFPEGSNIINFVPLISGNPFP